MRIINQIPELTEKHLTRFFSKINFTDNKDDCWDWRGAPNTAGYGSLRVGNTKVIAHRLAYYLHYGEMPKHLLCCHHCDRRICCNPYHLFLGTDLDNSLDKESKNRGNHCGPHTILRGSERATSKLTEDDIPKIFELSLIEKKTDEQIASLYSVNKITIWSICNRKTWRHVNIEYTEDYLHKRRKELILEVKKASKRPTIQGSKNHVAKITERDVETIIRLRFVEKMPAKEIAKIYGLAPKNIQRIYMRKSWKHVKINPIDINRELANRPANFGSNNTRAKLKESDVQEIINLKNSGLPYSELSKQYNVSDSLIGRICRRQAWKHVDIE